VLFVVMASIFHGLFHAVVTSLQLVTNVLMLSKLAVGVASMH
jgi:hypothetical protein